jgi:DNA-binding transcriptional regulator YbjK
VPHRLVASPAAGWSACATAGDFLYFAARMLVGRGHHGKKRGGEPSPDLRDLIVDTAVELAEEGRWENLRLRKVAERLGVPLTVVSETFRDVDAVADAWFTRALTAMLRPPEAGFDALSARERAHAVLMRWFDAQAAHRRVVGEMLRARL